MRTKILNALKVSALAVVLSVGIGYVYAWTAPTGLPGTNNAAAPINISSIAQEKSGTFSTRTNLGHGLSGYTTDTTGIGVLGTNTSIGGLAVAGYADPTVGIGVVGVGFQGVIGAGAYGVRGNGYVADFVSANTGIMFPDNTRQTTAASRKVCRGSNGSTYDDTFTVATTWNRADCFNALWAEIQPLSWWSVGCMEANSITWGSIGGGLPMNNSCGWDVPPPPGPRGPRPTLYCAKYPNDPACL